ncbi:hypothetical protein Mycch_5473 (plasmid) [Mycolicibacterium chubuense NBB4]|uniref:Uncharacterized protein n=1 Tax=Mycolicibacterium chubuense (strain NBB4) TaxID=710421 RepID=I4BS84_MYCCN|nr:hypothetical protein [Mycolicibacterium chubuense]AFM20141.1 hypothetical protein Mycch_5473 [Mycolicibacterium chubuense NBB4]
MTNKVSKSKSAVRAAREAVKASQKEVLERAARNAEDLAVFFSSRERLDAVEEWLEAKTAGLKEQAEGKRAEHRRTAGLAVIALRDRGETLRDISRLTGANEKALRELTACAKLSESAVGDAYEAVGGALEAQERLSVVDDAGEALPGSGQTPALRIGESSATG